MTKGKKYLDFLKYSLSTDSPIPASTNGIDWMEMLAWAESQAIVGIIFQGIERGGKQLQIPFGDLMEWVGYAQQIEEQNRILNKKCTEVVKEYREMGLDCMVLKGQGNAVMYPNPLLRTSGDIDVWVWPKLRLENGDWWRESGKARWRENNIKFAREKDNNAEVRYYHVGYKEDYTEIEAHFMPGVMNNPIYNRRLQAFYRIHTDNTVSLDLPGSKGCIPVPCWEMNVVFQLAHIMHHFFDEGVGLRQIIDYYYLLKSGKNNQLRDESLELRVTLQRLNLYKFAGAVMYVLKEALGMEEKYLIVQVDEKRGKTLLRRILNGGNFGRYSGLAQNNPAKKFFQKTWRNMQLVKDYPAEALCEPAFRTWHFFWRLAH